MEFRPRGHRQVGIELSPLIDVVFQLLIFFAVTTSFLQVSGLELELPESDADAPERTAAAANPAPLVIELAADGSMTFRGDPITLEALEEQLRGALAERGEEHVVLRADRDARHGQVVAIMDIVRRAGARGLSVATRPREPPRPPPAASGAPASRR